MPADENGLVVNTYLLKTEPDLRVGSDIVLKLGQKETTWRVVGIVRGTPPMPLAYVNLPYLASIEGGAGRAGIVIAVTDAHEEPQEWAWSGSSPAVALIIQKQSGANTVRVIETIKERLKTLKEEVPA